MWRLVPSLRHALPLHQVAVYPRFVPEPISRFFPYLQRQQQTTMSDSDYAAFLQKAQKDYSGSASGTTSADKVFVTSKTANALDTSPHPAIKALGERTYTSEIDEIFEPVSLEWNKTGLPGIDEFGKLIGSKGEISVLEYSAWDPNHQYNDVTHAVNKACTGGDVRVYRVESGSRVEYFILGLDSGKKRLLGVKVKAIET